MAKIPVGRFDRPFTFLFALSLTLVPLLILAFALYAHAANRFGGQ